jgi:23S rRNA-/tRNA-specific pseudouridylate synthase
MDPSELEERIILQEHGLIVINKPPDMPTSGRTLTDDDCLQFWLMRRHGAMVWAVHQLDADTSGVNLFVTEKSLVAVYKSRMEHPDCSKRYLAWVHGVPTWEERSVHAPIGKVDARSLGVTAEGRAAHSLFRVRDRGARHTLLEVRITTGRTHQIRIHAAHLGHPLVGEEWYRTSPCLEHPRQALHAAELQLPDGTMFSARVPNDLRELSRRCIGEAP